MTDSDGRRWYVVYSKPHKEHMAEFHLRLKGIEVFLPLLLLPSYVSRRRRIVPLFPNYLFVRIHISEASYDEYHYVRWTPGVKSIVGINGTPTPLDEEVVRFIMQLADPRGIRTARSNLRVGQEVQITGGPFEGIVGIIQEPPNAKGRVKVLMQLLRRNVVKVDVPVQFVKSGWVV